MQTKVLVPNLSAVHQQSLKVGELLPPGYFWEFSTEPGCCPCEALGQIIAVSWPPLSVCSTSLFATLFPNACCCPPAHHERGVVPWRSCPGQAEEPWAAGTATVLRQLCKALGSEPAPRSSCCCPSTSPTSGALAAAFLQQIHEYFYFCRWTGTEPSLICPMKIKPLSSALL